MNLAMIVACGKNNAIGKNNRMPWHLPADLQYFKRVTLGKPIIMGRKTFESIGKPLPGRLNIVISRSDHWEAPEGVAVVDSIDKAIDKARDHLPGGVGEVMVIGGEQIYRAALTHASRIYKTEIEIAVEGADAFFPELNENEWREVSRQSGEAGAPLPHHFIVLERNVKPALKTLGG